MPSRRLLALMDKEERTESARERKREAKNPKAEAKETKVMSKSTAAKKAVKGEDMGKKGKNFNKIASKAAKEYGSKSAGERVAGAIFQKMRRSGKL